MTYEGWCKAKDVIIEWDKPVDDVYNLVRGANPSPGAGTTLNGTGIQFYSASKSLDDSGKASGEIVDISVEGIRIACKGGSIRVEKVKPAGAGKTASSDWAKENGINIGDTFGS